MGILGIHGVVGYGDTADTGMPGYLEYAYGGTGIYMFRIRGYRDTLGYLRYFGYRDTGIIASYIYS